MFLFCGFFDDYEVFLDNLGFRLLRVGKFYRGWKMYIILQYGEECINVFCILMVYGNGVWVIVRILRIFRSDDVEVWLGEREKMMMYLYGVVVVWLILSVWLCFLCLK